MNRAKKPVSVIMAVVMLIAAVFGMAVPVNPAEAASANLVANPGFEEGGANWVFNKAGVATNNVHSGARHANVNKGTGNYAMQQVVIPATGMYKFSGWFSTGGVGGKLSLRKSGGAELKSITIAAHTVYTFYEAADVPLNKGDTVELVVNGSGSNWVNFDDVLLIRDDSKHVNIVANPAFDQGSAYWNFSATARIITDDAHSVTNAVYIEAGARRGITQRIVVPVTGPYKLSAWISARSGGGMLGLNDSGGNPVRTITIPASAGYSEYVSDNIVLNENDVIELFVDSGAGPLKADDISLQFDLAHFPNTPPSAASVTASGKARVGSLLTGSYRFNDADSHNEGTSIYRWLYADTVGGAYSPIAGATAQTFIPTADLEGKLIKFEVTPVDQFGAAGVPVLSEATSRVDRNFIANPGFELDRDNWSFSGANIVNRTNSPTVKPYAGLVHGFTNAGTSNKISQTVTVPRTAVYYLSVRAFGEGAQGGVFGLKHAADGRDIAVVPIPVGTDYTLLEFSDFVLEQNDSVEIYVKGGTGGRVYADDFELVQDYGKPVPTFKNIVSFQVPGQFGNTVINKPDRTVSFKMPYGTDLTSIAPVISVSDGATLSPPSGTARNFSSPVAYTITAADGTQETWTVTAAVMNKTITIDSSNAKIKEAFTWAVPKALNYVQTGKRGLINKDERGTPTSINDYIPSYWAGYAHRYAFYARDMAHQTAGAHLIGLDEENLTMFRAFASTSNEARKWYTLWALNFDGSPFLLDYRGDNNFVREIPAVFELVEKAYQQYLWTGNDAYINDPVLWNFYTKAVTDFIELHDGKKPNGVAEGAENGGIFNGTPTYNERGEERLIEAGDGIATQYQAFVAYAKMLAVKGMNEEAARFEQKAAQLKAYFNEEWGVKEGVAEYVRGYDKAGTAFSGFGKEGSWFMPMKLITEPGPKNDAFLAYIDEMVQTPAEAPKNIEAYTYLPDTFFPYGKNDIAWKWMQYIIDRRDQPHEVRTQGTNGDYPEVSYTIIGHTVEGLMGIKPNAPGHGVATLSRLPSAIEWLELNHVPVGGHELKVKHEGATKTTLRHNEGQANLTWEAQFYGTADAISVNGQRRAAQHKTVNGVPVSYTTVVVQPGETVVAETAGLTGEAKATWTGAPEAELGASFELKYGLANTTGNVFAQDVTVTYDPELLEFVSASPLVNALSIVGQDTNTAGRVRLLAAAAGPGASANMNGELLLLRFKSKPAADSKSTAVRLAKVVVSTGEGVESELQGSEHTIRMYTRPTGDLNGDGRYSVGDLGIMSAHYGKTSASPDWSSVRRADLNQDGRIDIADIAELARLILQ